MTTCQVLYYSLKMKDINFSIDKTHSKLSKILEKAMVIDVGDPNRCRSSFRRKLCHSYEHKLLMQNILNGY